MDVGADLGAQVQRVLEMEQPDVAYIHHVSSPALIEQIRRRLPSAAYVHGFTAVCPGMAKYFRRNDMVCERPFGWGCIPMHYLRRCSAARHPQTLARLMQNTADLRLELRKLPAILVGSQYMADLLAQNGFPAARTTILAPHFLPDDTRLTYSPPAESTNILFAGRLEIEKGFPYLLQAMVELPPAVNLLVAGDGTQRSSYEVMAHELGLGDRVHFLGWLDEQALTRVFDRCTLLAMPTISPESFGKAGVEAVQRGRPVVAFDVGGITSWLQEGVNGYLVPPTDSKALAGRIVNLLQDEALCTQFGMSGQDAVLRQYKASRHRSVLMEVFTAAIEDSTTNVISSGNYS